MTRVSGGSVCQIYRQDARDTLTHPLMLQWVLMIRSLDRQDAGVAKRISASQAKAHLSQLMAQVAYRGERYVIERRGKPMAALVSLADFDALGRLQGQQRQAQLSHLAARAAQDASAIEPTEEEIAEAVRATRDALNRERHGAA